MNLRKQRNGQKRAALLTAVWLCGCGLLTGCGSGKSFWVGIEPAANGSFGEPKYEDGTYLTQEVREPAPDPYADDTNKCSEGTTADGICYAVYDRHVEITGHTAEFSAEILTLPAELEGKPVSRIADVAPAEDNRFALEERGAFYGCYTLKKVMLPDTLTRIGDYAFYSCKNLRVAEIPESVTEIGSRAFSMCRKLEDLSVPTGIGKIGDGAFAQTPWYDNLLYHKDLVIFNGLLYDAGRRCEGLVKVPDYVIAIADYAFYDSSDLKSIVIPASVKKIGKCAFCACSSLSTIVIENAECEICEEASTISNKNVENSYVFNGTIRGAEGSSAEKYAKQHDYRFSSDTEVPENDALPPEPSESSDETESGETDESGTSEENESSASDSDSAES
jgi:hypothetical protein